MDASKVVDDEFEIRNLGKITEQSCALREIFEQGNACKRDRPKKNKNDASDKIEAYRIELSRIRHRLLKMNIHSSADKLRIINSRLVHIMNRLERVHSLDKNEENGKFSMIQQCEDFAKLISNYKYNDHQENKSEISFRSKRELCLRKQSLHNSRLLHTTQIYPVEPLQFELSTKPLRVDLTRTSPQTSHSDRPLRSESTPSSIQSVKTDKHGRDPPNYKWDTHKLSGKKRIPSANVNFVLSNLLEEIDAKFVKWKVKAVIVRNGHSHDCM